MRKFKYNLLKSFFITISCGIVMTSCSRKEVTHFYSLDKQTCLTVITLDTLRYIVAGQKSEIPDTNYVKLDISNVSSLEDGIWICWTEHNGWDVVVHKSKIIENRLDSTKYLFSEALPKDERGTPYESKFKKENCAIYGLENGRYSPNKKAIVEK